MKCSTCFLFFEFCLSTWISRLKRFILKCVFYRFAIKLAWIFNVTHSKFIDWLWNHVHICCLCCYWRYCFCCQYQCCCETELLSKSKHATNVYFIFVFDKISIKSLAWKHNKHYWNLINLVRQLKRN